jgi:hypothetical protein
MGLRHSPTPTNRAASRDVAPAAARAMLQALASATAALTQLAIADSAEPSAVVEAVAAYRAGQAAVDHQLTELLAIAVSGGAAVSTTARRCGVRPQTLADRLVGSRWIAFRGLDLVREPNGDWVVTK